MADNTWVFDLPDKIYKILKAVTYEEISALFENPKYITIDETVDYTAFPTIRIGSLAPIEIGSTLDGISINGITITEQIEVYVNTSTTDARKLASIMQSAIKLLGFNVIAFPEVQTKNGVYTAVARYRRDYGADDSI